MSPVLMFFATSIWVLVLYLLNRAFNYKDKFFKHFGIVKYKITLFIIVILVFLIIRVSFNIKFFENPIGFLIFWSYLYLIQNPEHYR